MKKCFLLIYTLHFPIFLYSQKVEIMKDTVCLFNECFELQELKINSPAIYRKIQGTYNLFDTNEIFTDWKERLNYKKKVFRDNKSFEELQGYGFESYEINFYRNNLMNITIFIQSIGSAFEGETFLTFDLKKDKELGIKLFKNKRKLFNIFLKQIRDEEGTDATVYIDMKDKYNDISQFKIIKNQNGDMTNMVFLFYNLENPNNPHQIDFTSSEIKPFLKLRYLKYFK